MFERWLIWYLGVDAPREPGMRLYFQWIWENPLQPWPVELIWLVLVAGWGLLFWSWRNLPDSRRRQVRVLIVRLVLWCLFLLQILQVSLRIGIQGRPTLLILTDVSESMLLEDDFDAASARQLQQMTGSRPNQSGAETGKTGSRLAIAQSVLMQQEGRWLAQLEDQTRVRVLPFTETLELDDSDAEGEAALPQRVEKLRSHPGMTNLRQSVQEALEAARSDSPVAIVVLTDGNSTSSPRDTLSAAAREQSRRKVPMYVIGVGASSAYRDVRIVKVTTERLAFPGDAIHVEVQLEGEGVASESVRVQLIDRATGEELDAEEVTLSGQQNKTSQAGLTLEHRANAIGLLDLEVRCGRISGEGQLDNNEARTRVWVRPGAVQVLLVERQPRWEYRHLKWSLERDLGVVLKTWLLEGDLETAVEDRTVLSRLPETLEEWLAYDVVVWGDVNPEAVHINMSQLESFVSEHGGGLMLLPGHKSPSDWNQLLSLSPVHRLDERDLAGPMALGLTPDGRATKFLQFEGHAGTAPQRLPPLLRSNYLTELRTGAAVLLEGLPKGQSAVPLLVEHHFGAGQVLMQLHDETWHWRPIEEGEVYRRYWLQLIRHLGKRKLDATQPEYDLFVDRSQYELNSPVTVTLFTRNALGTPLLELQESEGNVRSVPMVATNEPLKYAVQLEGLAPGDYTARVSGTMSLEAHPVTWKVNDQDPERTYRPLNLADLKEAARLSGGRFYRPWEATRLPADLPSIRAAANQQHTVVSVWARWEILLLCVSLLALDWCWRN